MNDSSQPVLRAKRRLPTGRAVLGGLLVTLAVLGVLVASRIGEDATFQNVVVAREDLTPGTVLGPEHIAQVRIRLDESADWVISDAEDVVGSVLLGPVGRLEFVQRSNVAEARPGAVPAGLAEVSIAVRPERAPSSLTAGELVSVLATFDDVEPPTTQLIADRVVVLSFTDGDTDFSQTGAVLRLGLSDGQIASGIITAAQTGEISIIGVTGATSVQLPEETTR
jgi:Flp pilus assembly protein CpaB